LYKILQGLSLNIVFFSIVSCGVPSAKPSMCWGPLIVVLVISIKIKDVNRRVKCAARATRVRRVCSRVRRACVMLDELDVRV
jgi:hypothetical protein